MYTGRMRTLPYFYSKGDGKKRSGVPIAQSKWAATENVTAGTPMCTTDKRRDADFRISVFMLRTSV